MRALLLALALLLPTVAGAQEPPEAPEAPGSTAAPESTEAEAPPDAGAPGVAATELVAALMRLPDHTARRARIVQELSAPDLDELAKEQLGSALAVLGTLAADKRDDPYIVELFLLAALAPDPELRDEAMTAARRGYGPPSSGGEGEVREAAARMLLEQRWMGVRSRNGRVWVVDGEGKRLALSRFVFKARDGEIEAVLRRQSEESWYVFGGLFGAGFAASIGGGLALVAGSETAFDGLGGGRASDPEAARALGTTLVATGLSAILAGVIQRSVVATNHRVGYRRYYEEERLRELVDRRNRKAAEELGVSPEVD